MKHFLTILTCVFSHALMAQEPVNVQPQETNSKPKWYDRFSIGGYVQVRYNGLYESNPNLVCDQCDKAWGEGPNLSLRRARIIFQGQLHPQISFYIQPDFASAVSGSKNFVSLRDAYFDIGVDKKNEFRFRIGQSKVPYSFENLQSSRNRLSLDRNDGTNSSFVNERDLGVHFMWAPKKKKELFKYLVDNDFKGTGDYGIFSLGIVNGQVMNTKELNKNKHVVARFSYPFKIKEQLFEAGINGYTGKYQMESNDISLGVKHNGNLNYTDERLGVAAVWYPNPFGIQAEYNIGRGPQYNKFTDSIETRNLAGGYILINYRLQLKDQLLFPFAKYKYYNGGKKFEQDARSYHINELELGLEWKPWKYFELVVMYSFSERRFEDFQRKENMQRGQTLRIQAQILF